MGIANRLLCDLRSAGFVLTLTRTEGLRVAPRDALTDEHRAEIRAERDALVFALQAERSRLMTKPVNGNPLMTSEQSDACHAGGWDREEIEAFTSMEARFLRMGRTVDAKHLAERLILRNREQDDRRLCLECAWLKETGGCRAAATGRLAGVNRKLSPVQTILHRCEAFCPRPGLR